MYRIIQWATGNVGHHALRMIVERPDFELVGLRVYDPAKRGKDAGDLLETGPVGVKATDDSAEILALDADCVCYTPLGSTLDSAESALDDICAILASGKNVVSSAVEYHAYLGPGKDLAGGGAHAYQRISEACAAGNASFFHAGINPGFAMELWPLVLSQVCRRIDSLTVTEVVDMRRYPSIHMLNFIGFGAKPSQSVMNRGMTQSPKGTPFYLTLTALTDAMGVELDDVAYRREDVVTDVPLTVAAGTIASGTTAAIKFQFDGIVHGKVVVSLQWVWRVTDDVAPDWPTGDSRWILRVDGDPTLDSEFVMATKLDAGRAVSLSVATVNLNAVPAVCAAPPGLYNNLTIGVHGGGYLAP
jgi:2,4-diaminopentanoate dehydrogenase